MFTKLTNTLRRARRAYTTLAAFVLTSLGPVMVRADSGIFSGAANTGKGVTGDALNAAAIIFLALGAAGIVVGGFGMWKQPDKKQMWGHVIEASLVPIVIVMIAFAYFKGAAALTGSGV